MYLLTPGLNSPPPPRPAPLQMLESPVYSAHTWFRGMCKWQLGETASTSRGRAFVAEYADLTFRALRKVGGGRL
jgi:hypothetical protein